MSARPVERDERTTVVENAGYRWSYLTVSFGLLAVITVRSVSRGEASWDLLALLLLGGGVNAVYQGTRRVLYRGWVVRVAVTLIAAAFLASLIIMLRGRMA